MAAQLNRFASFGSSLGINPNSNPVVQFTNGFSFASLNSIISIESDTDKALQVQEPITFNDPNDSTKLIKFYSGWKDVTASRSGIFRCTASKDTPLIWTNNAEILASVDQEVLDYLRLNSVIYNSGVYRFYLSGGNGIIVSGISSDGLSIGTLSIVFELGTLGAILQDGSDWWMVYSASASEYRLAHSVDGIAWTDLNHTVITDNGPNDTGGIEWHQIYKINGLFYLIYEAYDGDNGWGICMAWASTMTGTWTKFVNRVLVKNAGSSFAQSNVATPSLHLIDDVWYCDFQGTNASGTGNGGEWNIGTSILNN